MNPIIRRRLFKTFVHLISAGWLALTFWYGVNDQLGADPVESLIHFTGMGALNLLLLTLMISPISKHFRLPILMQSRRLIGVYAFVYALAHVTSFLTFEIQLDFSLFLDEIVKRPYITVGMCAFLLISCLAITSFDRARKRMGKQWQRLHNWSYFLLFLIILHYCWSLKLLTFEPWLYIVASAVVLWFKREKLLKYFPDRSRLVSHR